MFCAACFREIPDHSTRCDCGQSPLLAGRYALLELVGKGAAGATYRARECYSGDIVAVKELVFHRVDSFKTQELFEREATILAQLSHPAIPRFIESFDTALGASICFYLVQDYIDGITLQQEMGTRRYTESDLRKLLREVAQILVYLHQFSAPVVHRDIKPSNIMRRAADGQLMLIDFGTVKDATKVEGGSTIAGTFGYMPPEQFRGEASPKSDIYGLGMTIIALAAGADASTFNDLSSGPRWQSRVQLSRPLIDLLAAMTDVAQTRRPSAAQVLTRLAQLDAPRPHERTARPVSAAGHASSHHPRSLTAQPPPRPATTMSPDARALYNTTVQTLEQTEQSPQHFAWAQPTQHEIVSSSNATAFARRKAGMTSGTPPPRPSAPTNRLLLVGGVSLLLTLLLMGIIYGLLLSR